MSLEKTRLKLISHSKLMVLAAESGDWERFAVLDNGWQDMLSSAHNQYGAELSEIKASLVEDNQKVQRLIEKEQKSVLTSMEKNAKGLSSLKSYLK